MMPRASFRPRPRPRPFAAPDNDRLLQGAFIRVVLLLIVSACLGAVVAGIVAAQLTPADAPVNGGRLPATRGIPTLTRVPSRVETNGASLTVTVHASALYEDLDHRITRYRVTVQPPNATPVTLCESPTEADCALSLNGTPAQRGIWIFTLITADASGATAEKRERMRVT